MNLDYNGNPNKIIFSKNTNIISIINKLNKLKKEIRKKKNFFQEEKKKKKNIQIKM